MMKFLRHKLTIGFLVFFLLIGVMAVTKPQIHAQRVQSTVVAVSESSVDFNNNPQPDWRAKAKAAARAAKAAAGFAIAFLPDVLVNLSVSQSFDENYPPTALDF